MSDRTQKKKKVHPFGIFALISILPYQILALFLVDNFALCTGLITDPNVALLTALNAARYPASSKRPFRVPFKVIWSCNVECTVGYIVNGTI